MVGSFLFFWVGQIVMPNENRKENSTFRVFEADWVQIMPDGEQVSLEIPGTCDMEYGEWGTIMTQLPHDLEETWICMRSMQQEMNIYVGDELRKEYSKGAGSGCSGHIASPQVF